LYPIAVLVHLQGGQRAILFLYSGHIMNEKVASQGQTIFYIVWLGQFVSVIGSGLTSFALGVWIFEKTGSATQFALIGLFAMLPRVVLSPLAGSIVDRWDRRLAMILGDAGAGFSTLILVLLLFTGRLEIWHIYLIVGSSAAFSTVQWPAYAAATTLLVPKNEYGRANGMIQLGKSAAEILAPAMAGYLVLTIQLDGVILIDFATFLFAIITLLSVRFPKSQSSTGKVEGFSLKEDIAFGWKYISACPGLLGLLVFFAAVNLLWGMVGALIGPMILDFTTSDEMGVILSVAGVGMLVGSLVMSIWGGWKRRINNVLFFEFLSGICFLLMGLRPSFWLIAMGAFGAHLTIAIVYGSNQAIWQSKVEPGVQGRVFAAQQMIAKATSPLAYLLAGPLADKVFEPLLVTNGLLTGNVGKFIGVGSGRGIGLLFIVMGMLKMAVTILGYAHPHIRFVEDELPDAIDELPGTPHL
jgi:DHA3 family macrolide efflux protein-like MFS transporter